MSLSYIIPHYHGQDLLSRCLESIKRQTYQPKTREIIVIADGSTDGSVAWLRDQHPDVQVAVNSRNLGFAPTVNRGLRMAQGEWLILVNNDVELAPASLEAASAWFSREEVGAVAFCLVNARNPELFDSAGDLYTVAGYAQKRHEGLPVAAHPVVSGPVFAASGAAAAFRARAVRAAGYLDESFEAYYEDMDLGLRLRLAGYECIFEKQALAYHLCGGSYGTEQFSPRRAYLNARNSERLFFKYFPQVFGYAHLTRHLAVLLLQLVGRLPTGREGLHFLRGKRDFFRELLRPGGTRFRLPETADKTKVLQALEHCWFRCHVATWREKARDKYLGG